MKWGNALWKEATLLKTITVDDALNLLRHISKIYEILSIITPKNQFLTLKVASTLETTYYDSAYIIAAAENNLTLVTDDKNFIDRIRLNEKELYKLLQKKVEALTTKDLLKGVYTENT